MAVHETKTLRVHRTWGLGAPEASPLVSADAPHSESRRKLTLVSGGRFPFLSFPISSSSSHARTTCFLAAGTDTGRTHTEHVCKRRTFPCGSHTQRPHFYFRRHILDDPTVADPRTGLGRRRLAGKRSLTPLPREEDRSHKPSGRMGWGA